MTDIVPELYEKILLNFEKLIKDDPKDQAYLKRLEKGTATQQETSLYARRLGEHAAKALVANLTEETLPDGKLYWNIAERTVKPLLQEVHRRVNDAAVVVQEREYKEKGIGLKPQRAQFPEERVNALLNAMVKSSMEEAEDDETEKLA